MSARWLGAIPLVISLGLPLAARAQTPPDSQLPLGQLLKTQSTPYSDSRLQATQGFVLTHAATGSGITTLNGDVAATGTGTVAATLATVNTTPGSFGTASAVPTLTVNAKGLTTASGSAPISILHTAISDWSSTLSAYVLTTGLNSIATQSAPTAGSMVYSNGSVLLPVAVTGYGTFNNGTLNITGGGGGGGGGISTLSGDVTATGTGTVVATLASVGTAGTYGSASVSPAITVDGKGRVTAVTGTTITPSAIGAISALTGDATTGTVTSGSASLALATVNTTPGSFGSASTVPTITTNGKGLVTASGALSIAISHAQITDWASTLSGYVLTTALGSLAGQNLPTAGVVYSNGTNLTPLTIGANLSLSAGTLAANIGLTGITGDLSASGTGSVTGTLAIVNSTPGTVGSATTIPAITTNGKGLVTQVSPTAIAIPHTQVTDWSATLSAYALTASLGALATQGFPTTGIVYSNGTGLSPLTIGANLTLTGSTLSSTGGGGGVTALTGDVTASGTGSVAATLASVGTAGTYGSATTIPTITTDTKGRVTAVSVGAAVATPASVTSALATALPVADGVTPLVGTAAGQVAAGTGTMVLPAGTAASALNLTAWNSLQDNAGNLLFNQRVVITGSCTLGTSTTSCAGTQNGDCWSVLYYSGASNITVTVPNTLPISCEPRVVAYGAGTITFAAASGATLHSLVGLVTTAEYDIMQLNIDANSSGSAAVGTVWHLGAGGSGGGTATTPLTTASAFIMNDGSGTTFGMPAANFSGVTCTYGTASATCSVTAQTVNLGGDVTATGTTGSTAVSVQNNAMAFRTVASGTTDTMQTTDEEVAINVSTTFTETVPACTTAYNKYHRLVTDVYGNAATNNITIITTSGTISKAAAATGVKITVNFGWVDLRCDGPNTNWRVIGVH